MATATTTSGQRQEAPEHEREESRWKRLDRNTLELLNELRVAATGIQVMLAFLLVVPFNTGFRRLSSFDRYDYFVTLLCIAVASVLLIAPSIHHRLLFRHGEKPFVVRTANRMAIVAMVFLAAGLSGILVLITDVIFGGVTAAVVGLVATAIVGCLWFAVPLRRLHRS